jgi:hypothetical protein
MSDKAPKAEKTDKPEKALKQNKPDKPDKPEKAEQAEKKKNKEESGLVSAAKTVGAAAGKIAALAETIVERAAPAKSMKIPKLAKKNKSRLPRRQKKAQQKARASQT